jgi:hypothetical protein
LFIIGCWSPLALATTGLHFAVALVLHQPRACNGHTVLSQFVRTIASWPVPFVFAGIAIVEVVQWVSRTGNQQSVFSIRRLLVVVFVGYCVNAALTVYDYFQQWPTGDYVRFWQQATWTQAVRTLNADRSSTPIAASGLSIQDFDPQTFELLGLRSDLKVKWFDCRNAMLYPQTGATTRYLTPAYLPCDTDLQNRFWPGAQIVMQPHWPDTSDAIITLQEQKGLAALKSRGSQLALRPVGLAAKHMMRAIPQTT